MAKRNAVYLVACVSKKRIVPRSVNYLYTSSFYPKARRYAEGTGCQWFILSAEHGLVSPDQVLPPYENAIRRFFSFWRYALT
ncbi:MAG: DUF6884 domain-containing protein [Pirellula sp.]